MELGLEGVLSTIERLIKLEDPSRALRLGELLVQGCRGLEGLAELTQPQLEAYRKLVQAVGEAVMVLSSSLQNLGFGGPLREDWRRLARRDLLRLKDCVLALREFLLANTPSFKPRPPWLKRLLQELESSGAVSAGVCRGLKAHFTRHPSHLENPQALQRLSWLKRWLEELERVRRLSHA